eukprot:1003998-Amphidinium_carterae.1
MGALRCHMDVQTSDGRGMLLRYCASYVPKFSDAFAQAWLNDQASDFAIARRVLSEYHPLEPELWMQLASFLCRPCMAGGTLKRFVVPSALTCPDPPNIVKEYMQSSWRCNNMNLLEFLRKSNDKGAIARHIRERHNKSAEESPLQDFANQCSCRGETMVATKMSSRFSDAYYAEWVVLNVPFRRLADLFFEDLERIPENYQGMALAVHHAPGFWRDTESVQKDLELHAFRDEVITSNLAMVESHIDVVDQYRNGSLMIGRDEVPVRKVGGPATHLPSQLHPEQWRVVDAIRRLVGKAMEEAWAEEAPAYDVRYIQAVLGPTGSGKSTAVQVAVQDAAQAGARVVIACPTRMLVADLRAKLPGYDIDSIHAVFEIFKPEQQTLDNMINYDLVIIEEVSQLSAKLFERLVRLWEAANRRPALVFVGDFAQLRGVQAGRASDSPRWRHVHVFQLHTMRRCKCPELKWKLDLLRTAKPNKAQLAKILRGHKAPSRNHRDHVRMTKEPTEKDIANIFMETPATTFVTISRLAASRVNTAAVNSMFKKRMALAVVPADPESNPENFYGRQQIWYEPSWVPVHIGMRVTFTQNVIKECDFVNGMSATVLGVHWKLNGQVRGIRVQTDTGYIIVVFPWTQVIDEHYNTKVTYFPMRLGYAHTLMKMQGATLDHLTLYLDAANVEAAGYVALSRVQYDANWRFVGDPTVHHFTPSTAV